MLESPPSAGVREPQPKPLTATIQPKVCSTRADLRRLQNHWAAFPTIKTRSQQTPNSLSRGYFPVLPRGHSCRKISNILECAATHNPKVAGSNPAPATNLIPCSSITYNFRKPTSRESSKDS
jgi:hypothetical protein